MRCHGVHFSDQRVNNALIDSEAGVHFPTVNLTENR